MRGDPEWSGHTSCGNEPCAALFVTWENAQLSRQEYRLQDNNVMELQKQTNKHKSPHKNDEPHPSSPYTNIKANVRKREKATSSKTTASALALPPGRTRVKCCIWYPGSSRQMARLWRQGVWKFFPANALKRYRVGITQSARELLRAWLPGCSPVLLPSQCHPWCS